MTTKAALAGLRVSPKNMPETVVKKWSMEPGFLVRGVIQVTIIRLMDKILHDPKDPKL